MGDDLVGHVTTAKPTIASHPIGFSSDAARCTTMKLTACRKSIGEFRFGFAAGCEAEATPRQPLPRTFPGYARSPGSALTKFGQGPPRGAAQHEKKAALRQGKAYASHQAASRNAPMLPHFSLFDFSGDPLGLGEGVGVAGEAGLGDTAGAGGVAAGAVAGAAGLF